MVKSDEAVSYLDFGGEFWPEVLLVASPGYEECCFRLRSVKLEVSPAGPFDALCSAGIKFLDHLVHVLPSWHPSEVVYEGEALGLDSLFHPIHTPSGVYRERNQRHG